MARGATKMKKKDRTAAKAPPPPASASITKTLTTRAAVKESISAAHEDHETNAELCDHSDVDPKRMQKVSQLLSDLFSSSFRLAVPSLYRGMVQNIQDNVLKDKLYNWIDHGFSPTLINEMASDTSIRDGIKNQIKLACDEELGDVVLRLSTEDAFDLTTELSARHGRDVKTWGPPCACSFAACLPCLERLVESVQTTPATPPAGVKPIDPTALYQWVEEGLTDGWIDDQYKASNWKNKIRAAWEIMAETLWELAAEIDPLAHVPKVKGALETLSRFDGIELFYMIVTRELEAHTPPAGFKLPGGGGAAPSSAPKTWAAVNFSNQYERMKLENRALTDKTDASAAAGDATGASFRIHLAAGIREQGNAAYAEGKYTEATEHYTRSIGYDPKEAIYPLNRAACLIKLKKFEEAERDCTVALMLQPDNHKAYFRRGVSRAGRGLKDEAAKDFGEVLRLQKDNKSAYEELHKLSQKFLADASLAAPAGAVKAPTSAAKASHLAPPASGSLGGDDASSTTTTHSSTMRKTPSEASEDAASDATNYTSSTSPGSRQRQLIEAEAARDAAKDLRDALTVVVQARFAYAFCQIVSAKTGVDVTQSLGFTANEAQQEELLERVRRSRLKAEERTKGDGGRISDAPAPAALLTEQPHRKGVGDDLHRATARDVARIRNFLAQPDVADIAKKYAAAAAAVAANKQAKPGPGNGNAREPGVIGW